MRKINKTKAAQISEIYKRMESIESQFDSLSSDLASQVQNLVKDFTDKHSGSLEDLEVKYREAAAELRGLVLLQVELMNAYQEKRSESWHDSDSGFDHRYWSELWSEFGDFLERAEYQEFDFEVKLKVFEFDELPSFSADLT